jgi:protein-disulfide isomerase
LRGTINGHRALDAAKDISLDTAQVLKVANEASFADVMSAHLRMGNSLAIAVTPGFVLKDVAILGYPGPKSMAKMIESVQRCGKAAC